MKTNSPEPVRRVIRIAVCGAGVMCAVAIAALLWWRHPSPSSVEDTEDRPAVAKQTFAATNSPTRRQAASGAENSSARTRRGPVLPEPTLAMRQLVDGVTQPERYATGFTAEQTAVWKEKRRQLVEQGAGAVPAVREFLAKNVDFDFGAAGKQSLGYESARVAMIDALAQIGGPLAVSALGEVLRTTAVPREIALLAQHLAKLEPDLHTREICDAARQTLAMAADGGLAGRDVAPLFEVFQKFGDASIAADLSGSAERWNYYSAIALAQLPEDTGVPALVRLATGQEGAGGGAKTPALQMLAQVSSQSVEARAALLEQARENKLSAYDWATIVPLLAGDQLVYQNATFENQLSLANPNHLRKSFVSAGQQSFYAAPLGALTLEQIDRQRALIDELASATSDPAATRALQQAKTLLSRRLPQTVSTTNGAQ